MNSPRHADTRHLSPELHACPFFEPIRILVVDDDLDIQANVRDILETDGYEVEWALSLAEVQQRYDWAEFTVVLLDRILPDGCTDDLLPEIRQRAPDTTVIVITGYKDVDAAIVAVQNGAADYLVKPIMPDALRGRLRLVVERRRLEQRIAHLAAIVESSDDAIIGTTLDGTITSWNGGAVRVYGYPPAVAVGRPISMLVPSGLPDELPQIFRSIQQGHSIDHFETVRLRADGQPIHVSLSISPVRDSRNRIVAASGIARDITKRKQLEQKLRQAERMALLGQMVSVLAHVGRNALQRIYARLELLTMQVAGQPEPLQDAQRIKLACDDLHKVQEDILTFAAGIKLHRVNCSIAATWRKAWSDIAPHWASRDAVMQEKVNDVNLSCFLDPSQFSVVFLSLFENSLGACLDPVRIDVNCQEVEIGGSEWLQVEVSDNGPGLTPEQEAHLFEPFFTTKLHATGLGLATAKRIVDAHDGEIAVSKRSGSGASITIRLQRNFAHVAPA